METIYVKLTVGDDSEIFAVPVPTALARLTRITNGRDSAIRNADIRFRYALTNASVVNVDNAGTWTSGTTTLQPVFLLLSLSSLILVSSLD